MGDLPIFVVGACAARHQAWATHPADVDTTAAAVLVNIRYGAATNRVGVNKTGPKRLPHPRIALM